MPNGARFEAFWGQNGRKGRRFPLFFAKKVPMGAHSQVGKFFRSVGDAMRKMLCNMNGKNFFKSLICFCESSDKFCIP